MRPPQWFASVPVASPSIASQIARALVERLLDAAGIDSFIEGSVVYSVQVRRRDLVRAREILGSSTELKDHWIQFPVE